MRSCNALYLFSYIIFEKILESSTALTSTVPRPPTGATVPSNMYRQIKLGLLLQLVSLALTDEGDSAMREAISRGKISVDLYFFVYVQATFVSP